MFKSTKKLNESSYIMLSQFLNERLAKETNSKSGEITDKSIELAYIVLKFSDFY